MNEPAPTRRTPSRRRAVLDANVLIPGSLRDTLLRAEEANLYEPFWSAETLREVERNLIPLLMHHADPEARAKYLIDTLIAEFPAATVDDYAEHLPVLTNHPGDRHVLAAAIAVRAPIIVTFNVRHFPVAALAPHRVRAQTPDRFLTMLFKERPSTMVQLLIEQGEQLRRPRTLAATLDTLSQHAPNFARLVRATVGVPGVPEE
ncbi:MAG: PIN domain-containing protein [Thermomicrobiales bacterium]